MRNLQEQIKKHMYCQKLFWPFTAWINCSIDLKSFANSWPSASNSIFFLDNNNNFFSQCSGSEQFHDAIPLSITTTIFFLTVGQNNFGNIMLFIKVHIFWEGHKILWNLHRRFVLYSNGQIYSGDFAKFFGLLRTDEPHYFPADF